MKSPRYVVVEKECCGTCIHYRQHYILTEHFRPYPLWYGHCGTPRVKRREPDESCPYWSPAETLGPHSCRPERSEGSFSGKNDSSSLRSSE